MDEKIIKQEQLRVERVTREIGERLETLRGELSGIKTQIVDIRQNFWDDVTVNLDNLEEAVETYASLKQQAEVLSERERSHRHGQARLKLWERLQDSPYFGRIDFREGGLADSESIYIGIGSFMDKDEMAFLIYDWRAPVSNLYYDYPPGPAQYTTPSGTISGNLELKRQFIIREGRIRSVFDTGITIGDELLQEVLGKQADPQMRSIVATIQKEQNRIIRNERSRLLIVQGAAGSGKTSAALQRVAYLLYRYREHLRSEHIVLFSPNPMFNSYVSTVLPELGEENMQQTTFQEYLAHRLGDEFEVEDPYDQLEYAYAQQDQPGYEARIEGIRYKASADYLALLDRYIAYLGKRGLKFRPIVFRGETLIPAERIADLFYSLDPSLSIPNRLAQLSEQLLKELRTLARKELSKPWVEEEIELLDNEAYMRAYEELRRKRRFTEESFDDYEREKELLGKYIVNERFKPIRAALKRYGFVDIAAVYRQLHADAGLRAEAAPDVAVPACWPAICEQTLARLDRSQLAYEDATPYLYLKDRIEGFRTNNTVRHVFIDEAQDYSDFQFAFLKRLFPRSKMTVLGDLNQAIHVHASGRDAFGYVRSLYGESETETIVLTRSYRSTLPIMTFASSMIAGGDQIVPFERGGRLPTVTTLSEPEELGRRIAERICELQAAGHRTIAVICKSDRESAEAYESLRGVPGIRRIGKNSAAFDRGVLVMPCYLAKGVEFDAVILYNASEERYGRESDRRLFYTACTRAMHELHLYAVGKASPFIAEAPVETYTLE